MRVVHHRTRGRQLLATKDVQPGHLLMRALPLACVPADTELDLRCSACLTPVDDSTSPCLDATASLRAISASTGPSVTPPLAFSVACWAAAAAADKDAKAALDGRGAD